MARNLAVGPLGEPLMGLVMFMIGLALVLPHSTFAMANFQTMAMLSDEDHWAAAMILIGATQMLSALGEWRIGRIVSTVIAGSVWMTWTVASLHSGSRGVMWAVGTAMVLGQALAYLRVKSLT